MKEWNKRKRNNETFQFGNNRKLKVENSTNDNAMPHVQQMVNQILKEYTRFMRRNANTVAGDLFQDNQWQYLDVEQDRLAKTAARNDSTCTSNDPTAAETLRRYFLERAANRQAPFSITKTAETYGEPRVQWLSSVDVNASVHTGQPPHGKPVNEWIDPLFQHQLWDDYYMRLRQWNPRMREWHA